MLSSLFSRFRKDPGNGLTRAEFDLISFLRISPDEPLTGKDHTLAQAMVAKGLLKAAGGRKFIMTEKAAAAFRSAYR